METVTRKSWWRRYLDISLIWKMGVALVLGAIVGLIVGPPIEVIEPFGTLFLRLLQMMIVPIVLFTLIAALSKVTAEQFGRVGIKILAYYMLTTLVAITIGIALAMLIQPGSGLSLPTDDGGEPAESPALSEVLLNMVPANPVNAMAEGNMLAILFFALVFGIALGAMGHMADKRLRGLADDLTRFFQAGAEVTFIVIRGVLEYAPIGVFALIAVTLGRTGADALLPLVKLTATVYGGVALQIGLYVLLLVLFGASIRKFFAAAREPMVTAFVTRSSGGTLPVTMRAADRMGIDEGVYGFSLPLGATINMDGTALYVGVATVFVANVAGVDLSIGDLIGIALVGTLASIGAAGVPGAGLIMLSLAITQAGLPFAGVALVAGVDAILDMVRTMCNVTGDLTGARIIDKTEPSLDRSTTTDDNLERPLSESSVEQ